MIIGINGRVGSGKDTVGRIIQYLIRDKQNDGFSSNVKLTDALNESASDPFNSGWEIKKFAGKLKQIASLLTGIPVEKFEDQDFKKGLMSTEWEQLIPSRKELIKFKDLSKALAKGCTFDSATATLAGAAVAGNDKNILYTQVTFPEQLQKYTVRGFLQRLGTEAIRDTMHPNAWVNALFADFKCGSTDGDNWFCDNWIITDCRFPNEAQAIVDKGGIVIRVTRPGENLADAHPSETSLDNWKFDTVIENSGSIEDLRDKVAIFLHTNNLL